MRRVSLLLLFVIICIVLSSCSILPKEEDFGTAPTIKAMYDPDYSLAYVTRGELSVTKSFSPKFSPSVETYLCFGESGVYFDKMYVTKGDSVKKGQLLATLVMDDIEEQINVRETAMDRLEIRLRQIDDLYEMKLDHLKARDDVSESEIEACIAEYESARSGIEDEMTVESVRLEDLTKKKNDRQIYAPMDGTVSYVRSIEDGAVSKAAENIIKISDLGSSLFTVPVEDPGVFDYDTVYVINSNGNEYESHFRSAADIGVPEEINSSGKISVYFELDDPAAGAELSEGTSGSLTVVLEYRPDTLYVPIKAVQTQGDKNGVYVKDESGLQKFKEVEIGIANSKFTEILSGLKEGDEVIVK